jgi:ABC-2 type transport system permease protein
MTDKALAAQSLSPRTIPRINAIGLQTLIGKEVGRFLNVYTQTIIAPMVTALLFYAVFALAFGGIARSIGDVPYMTFIAPGLILMTMVQNAFANTSSSIVIAKVQGNIVDVLMPPLSAGEFFTGYAVGGVLRGLVVGVATGAVVFLFIGLHIHSLPAIIAYGVEGTLLLSSIGLAAGIWSEKFDHIAAVTNFIVTPLTFLSGTFYSIQQLPPAWQHVAHWNPFFYMIDGFRYGFVGHADGNLAIGLAVLTVINILMAWLCWWMIRTGYKIKS